MATKASPVGGRCENCQRAFGNNSALGSHYRHHPECKPAFAVETFAGHTLTIPRSVRQQPVILVPGILFALIGAIYLIKSPGLMPWALLLGAPLITALTWWIIMRGALTTVVVLTDFKGIPVWDWQHWPNNVAERLPDESRWLHRGKPIYVLDRWGAGTHRPFLPLIDRDNVLRPELVARFITQRDHQVVNKDFSSGIKPEVVKTGLMVAIFAGLCIGSFVVIQNILEL